MELTNLEICKRIAEIEGLEVATAKEASAREYNSNVCVILPDGEHAGGSVSYNPITDDALCFKLTKKHRVSIDYFEDWQRQGEDKNVLARLEVGRGIYSMGTVDFCKGDDSLNKAICLAIIEAHK